MQIRTISGRTFDIAWSGIATIDGALRFEVVGSSFPEVFGVFSRVDDCKTLLRVWDGVETAYTGYTRLVGIMRNGIGNIIVAMERQ